MADSIIMESIFNINFHGISPRSYRISLAVALAPNGQSYLTNIHVTSGELVFLNKLKHAEERAQLLPEFLRVTSN